MTQSRRSIRVTLRSRRKKRHLDSGIRGIRRLQTFNTHGARYSRSTSAAAFALSLVTRSDELSQTTVEPDRYAMLPRMAVLVERWPVSMSQIGAWRDLMQST